MKRTDNSRRKFLQKCMATNLFLLGGTWMVSSCGSQSSDSEGAENGEGEPYVGDPCNDMTGVSEDELAKRKQFGYVEKTPIPENTCRNCQLFIPPEEEGGCGACLLFKGPVLDDAYCTYWAPQV